MGFGNTTKTTSHSTSKQTPIEAANVTAFRNSLYPQISNYLASAREPLYGQAELSTYLNSLNKNTEASRKALASRFASSGGNLNSGAFASSLNDLFINRLGSIADYQSKIPVMNRQYADQNFLNAMGMASNFAGRAPVGQETVGDSESTQKQTQGLGSSLLSVGMAALGGAFPGLGMIGGGRIMGKLFNPLGLGQGGGDISMPGITDPYAGLEGNGWGTPTFRPPTVNPVGIPGYDYYRGY